MFGGNNDKQDSKWKQKYYDSLEQFEKQEKQYAAIETALSRGIARLSHGADGINPILDGYLNDLRKSISGHKGINQTLKVLDEVCQTIDRIGKISHDSKKTAPVYTARDAINQIITEISFPGVYAKEAKKISASAKSAKDTELKSLSKMLGAVINNALQKKPSKEISKSNTGLFQRITGKPDLKLSAPRSEEINLDLSEILIQLLERLNFPHDMEKTVDKLKASFSTGIYPDQLGSALGEVATLVSDMRHRMQEERYELEKFLKQLTDNLKYLDDYLQRSEQERNGALQGSKDLDKRVQAHVRDIETSVIDADSLEALKGTVQTQLDQIRRHMVIYLQSEEERNKRMTEHMQELTTRLDEMESETTTLRESVIREREQAMLDPLTGINNRLAYNERMTQEYARWRRYENNLSMAVVDLDFFKRINDNYGHKAGDKVLQTVARMMNNSLRETDFLARYGGEEFVILFTETDIKTAMGVMDKLREKVANTGFHFKDERVPVTISCGVGEFRGDDTPEQVFTRADTALYRAKEAGRNRCMYEMA